jgi:predicted CxxxxCH...CXXCH cytochrome family protein
MRKNMFIGASLGILLILFVSGCTNLKEDLPTPQNGTVQVHPKGWINSMSPNFHLNAIEKSGWDLLACRKCHGAQYTGGIVNVSCMKCHVPSDLPTTGTSTGNIHPVGWTDSTSVNFHGKWIGDAGWNMSSCQKCHGKDYAGGITNVACTKCHTKSGGPENCTTCHGGENIAPPKDLSGNMSASSPGVGAHQAHLVEGEISSVISCTECHAVPESFSSAGHIDSARTGALVAFNGMLATTPTGDIVPKPKFNSSTLRCQNTYCHGNFTNGNTTNAPLWNDTTGAQAACGTCHGDITQSDPGLRARPKSSANGGTHPQSTNCMACHRNEIDKNLNFTDKSKHINGVIDVVHTKDGE